MIIDAFHLPAIASPPFSSSQHEFAGQTVELRLPTLTPADLQIQIEKLLSARLDHLANRPVDEIVHAIDRVATRLRDGGDELRRAAEAGVGALTGLSAPMVQVILDRMASSWRRDSLLGLLSAELGDRKVLDAFTYLPARGTRTRAYGAPLAFHVFSGNVPGVAVTSLIRSLLVKSATLGKTASSEPVLASLFAQALSEEDQRLGECLAVTYWEGGDHALESIALARAHAVIAYGSRTAIESLRGRVHAGATFHPYGNRLSFGVIAREALSSDAADQLALDAAMATAMFDQQGCVSPHLFYVETGGEISPRDWARSLARALEQTEGTLPRGQVPARDSAAIRQARSEAEFSALAGSAHEVHASTGGTAWTVIFDPDPGFVPSCLNRLVRVKPVESIEEIPERVGAVTELLQTVGVAGPPERISKLADALGPMGVSRLARFSEMPWPRPAWHHDGRPPLAELVRWCDWDEA